MEPTTQDDVRWALDTILPRRAHYQLYDAYYRGKHRQVFEIASEQYERYFRALLERVRENLCKPVVRCFSERLYVEGWEGNGEATATVLAKDLRLSRLMNRVHTDALKLGDGYVLVWPYGGVDTKLWRQKPDEVAVRSATDDPNRVELAAKVWQPLGSKLLRLNLYYEDRLERYAAERTEGGENPKADAFHEWEDADGPATVPHSWGQVPMVRFGNDIEDEAAPGISMLEDVVPLQDVLNKELADLLIASEFFALPMRVFTGVQTEVNPATGKDAAAEFNPRRDRSLFFGGEGTKAIQLPSADLKAAIELTDSIALKIARVSGVPMHYLVLGQGDFPSGEALRTAEARLVSKVDDLHDEWGPQWQAIMGLLGVDATPKWGDPAHITETEELARLETKKRLGLPWQTVMEELGYNEVQVAEMEAQKQAAIEEAQAAFAKSFDAE